MENTGQNRAVGGSGTASPGDSLDAGERAFPGGSSLLRPEDHLRRWFQIAATALGVCSVVAAQTLMEVPGWSRLGIISVLGLLVVLGVGRMVGAVHFSVGRWIVLPFAFLAYSMIRSVPVEGESWEFDQMLQVISAFLLGLGIALALESTMPFRWLAYAQVISSYASIIGGFFSAGSETESRYSGLVGNANEFALQLNLGAVLVWLFPKKSGWVACVLSLIAAVYGVATSGSRNALVILPLLLLICFLQVLSEIKRHRGLVLFGVATLGLALCFVVAILSPILFEQASHITAVKRMIDLNDSSFDKRSAMIRTAIRLWQESPIFGNGSVAFVRHGGFGGYSHNNYVELLCNMGVVGLCLYYAAHVCIVFQGWWLPLSLRLMCWGGVLLNLASDNSIVSYDRKQTILLLMVMVSLAARCQIPRWTAAPVAPRRAPWPGDAAAEPLSVPRP
jgi:O-antigen ligase